MNLNEIIAVNLKRLRAERGFSLGKLSELSGVSKVMLSQIEKGESNPTINTLWKIAGGLQVSYTKLIDEQIDAPLLIRKEESVIAEYDGYRAYHYNTANPARDFEFFNGELDAHKEYTSEGHGMNTHEYLLVTRGEMVLRYGGEDADADVLRRAAEVAQATEFIDELPDGFETAISQGGTNVSGGQRQRLSIARALVKKAPVYIFDDTFSALDFKTDAKLRKALKGYTEGATVLIVAQRVSTIMHAEQIVVLDEGRVMGIGTHRELLASCKTYREIAESQLSKEELA